MHPIEDRLEAIQLVQKGYSFHAVSKKLKVTPHTVIRWYHCYDAYGYDGLLPTHDVMAKMSKKCHRTCKKQEKSVSLQSQTPQEQAKKKMARPQKKAANTELEKLKEENEYLRAELDLLKKVRALMNEKDAQLRRIGQKPSNH